MNHIHQCNGDKIVTDHYYYSSLLHSHSNYCNTFYNHLFYILKVHSNDYDRLILRGSETTRAETTLGRNAGIPGWQVFPRHLQRYTWLRKSEIFIQLLNGDSLGQVWYSVKKCIFYRKITCLCLILPENDY